MSGAHGGEDDAGDKISARLIADLARLRMRSAALAAELAGLRARIAELEGKVTEHQPATQDTGQARHGRS